MTSVDDRPLLDEEPDLRLARERRPGPRLLVEVHVEVDDRALLEQQAVAVGQHPRLGALGHAAQQAAQGHGRLVGAGDDLAVLRPRERAHVMHARALGSGPQLPAPHPDVVRQHVLRNPDVERDVDVEGVVRHHERLLHADDEVRRAVGPAVVQLFRPDRGGRRVGPVTGGRTRVDPAHASCRSPRRFRPRSFSNTPVGADANQGRHLPRLHLAGDGTRPRARLLVVHERHRSHQTADVVARRPVTCLAIVLNDGQHVLVVRHRGLVGRRRRTRQPEHDGDHRYGRHDA